MAGVTWEQLTLETKLAILSDLGDESDRNCTIKASSICLKKHNGILGSEPSEKVNRDHKR